MKKLIIIFCITCISVSAIAQSQSGVRIGSYVFHVQKADPDSLINVYAEDNPCPPCPSENEIRPQPKTTFKRYNRNEGFCGIGFILPDNGNNYYTALGGNSINIDVGNLRTYHLSRWFALGSTLQYSYYNYRLKLDEPLYLNEVFKNRPIEKDDIAKQVFRSHNVAIGAFTRFYLIPPKNRGNDGLFIDFGAQGDFAFSRYCMIKTQEDKKYKYRDAEAFNPFSASAIARIGWKGFPIRGNSGAFFARYRFTDAFNSKVLPMDLPPITIGIQFF